MNNTDNASCASEVLARFVQRGLSCNVCFSAGNICASKVPIPGRGDMLIREDEGMAILHIDAHTPCALTSVKDAALALLKSLGLSDKLTLGDLQIETETWVNDLQPGTPVWLAFDEPRRHGSNTVAVAFAKEDASVPGGWSCGVVRVDHDTAFGIEAPQSGALTLQPAAAPG